MNRDRALKTAIQRKGLEMPPAEMSQLIMQRIAAKKQRRVCLYEQLSYLWASLGSIVILVISGIVVLWSTNPDTTTLFADYFNTLQSGWTSITQFNFSLHIPVWVYFSLFIGGITFLLLLIDHRVRRYYTQKHKERHYA